MEVLHTNNIVNYISNTHIHCIEIITLKCANSKLVSISYTNHNDKKKSLKDDIDMGRHLSIDF